VIVTLVAAVAENGVIGRAGRLPWRLPADLRHFRRLTTGHTVVMGRRTQEEIRRPLAGRRNIVLTRRPGFRAEGFEVAGSLEAALALAAGEPEVFVIGGGEVYCEALPRADRMVLTHVHAAVEGDTRFPAFDPAGWRVVGEELHPADEANPHRFTIRRYERRAG
jgi:dihydrofolate reductase